jgi:hypothetical protein
MASRTASVRELLALLGASTPSITACGTSGAMYRKQDANTMAVLWQLGVDFIQGHYVRNPNW